MAYQDQQVTQQPASVGIDAVEVDRRASNRTEMTEPVTQPPIIEEQEHATHKLRHDVPEAIDATPSKDPQADSSPVRDNPSSKDFKVKIETKLSNQEGSPNTIKHVEMKKQSIHQKDGQHQINITISLQQDNSVNNNTQNHCTQIVPKTQQYEDCTY